MTTKGTTGSLGAKDKFDRFYTKGDTVDFVLETLALNEYDVIIEPSAGAGAFSSALSRLHNKVWAFDIQPENKEIAQQDWLEFDYTIFSRDAIIDDSAKTLVVGNPPFGSNGSLALRFIRKSAEFADTIAFILPKGFMKKSVMARIPLDFHLRQQIALSPNSFTLDGRDYSVPCVWQVWDKLPYSRRTEKSRPISQWLVFCDKSSAEFRVQRVGGNAGKPFLNTDVSVQSNYFLRRGDNLAKQMSVKEVVDTLSNVDYVSVNHTTGPRSLPKSEFIEVTNQIFSELLSPSRA